MPELYFQNFPGPEGATPLLLAHGLFGSSSNWRGVARRLSGDRRVLAADMRNHGRSFQDHSMSYAAMAGDILDTLQKQGLTRAHLLGHSMGGKAAMVAALQEPGAVASLVVVDIAPVIYTHSHTPLIDAMMAIDAAALRSRGQADRLLKDAIDDTMTRQFLLQSLERADQGYRWRLNLEVLKQSMGELVGFPDMNGKTFDGPALFLRGAESEYVQGGHQAAIERYFPNAEYESVDNAGHWVHADQPQRLVEQVAAFIRFPGTWATDGLAIDRGGF